MNCYEFVLDLKKIIVCLIDTVNSNKIVPVGNTGRSPFNGRLSDFSFFLY